jgi:hypothetical protein
VILVVAMLAGACADRQSQREGSPTPSTSSADAASRVPKAAELLDRMGIDKLYVMAGDDRLHAGLGVLSRDGLAPIAMKPADPLMSNLSGNGATVVVGAAGVDSDNYMDGVYRIDGDTLTTLADPTAGLFGPTIARDGTVAAIRPDGGFFTRAVGQKRWQRDERLRQEPLSSIAWGVDGDAYTLTRANTRRAQLVTLMGDGLTGRPRAVGCASGVLASFTERLVATTPFVGEEGACAEKGGIVLNVATGHRSALPAGWVPIAWSADSASLLLARGTTLSVWTPESNDLGPSLEVATRVWMGASVGS